MILRRMSFGMPTLGRQPLPRLNCLVRRLCCRSALHAGFCSSEQAFCVASRLAHAISLSQGASGWSRRVSRLAPGIRLVQGAMLAAALAIGGAGAARADNMPGSSINFSVSASDTATADPGALSGFCRLRARPCPRALRRRPWAFFLRTSCASQPERLFSLFFQVREAPRPLWKSSHSRLGPPRPRLRSACARADLGRSEGSAGPRPASHGHLGRGCVSLQARRRGCGAPQFPVFEGGGSLCRAFLLLLMLSSKPFGAKVSPCQQALSCLSETRRHTPLFGPRRPAEGGPEGGAARARPAEGGAQETD